MVSVDVYRPAARHQLSVIAREIKLPIYEARGRTKPAELARPGARPAAMSVDIGMARLHIDGEFSGLVSYRRAS